MEGLCCLEVEPGGVFLLAALDSANSDLRPEVLQCIDIGVDRGFVEAAAIELGNASFDDALDGFMFLQGGGHRLECLLKLLANPLGQAGEVRWLLSKYADFIERLRGSL